MKTHLSSHNLIYYILITCAFLHLVGGSKSATASYGLANINTIKLTISGLTWSSFNVSWSSVSGATSYKIWVMHKTEGSSTFVAYAGYNGVTISGSVVSYFVQNIAGTYETDYERKVILKSYVNAAETDQGETIVDLSDLPKITSVTNITTTSFVVNWLQPAGNEDDHRLKISERNSGGSWVALTGYPVIVNKPVATKLVTGLNPNIQYFIQLEKKDGTTWTAADSKYCSTAPVPPVAKAATEITPNSFKANWDKSDNVTGYYFYLKEKVSGKYILKEIAVSHLLYSYVAENLESGMSYEYYVTSKNQDAVSEKSNTISVTTVILSVPVALSANNINATSFNARWNAVSGATGYKLEVSDGNTWKYYSTTTTNYTLTNLTPSFSYEYRVRATFSSGISGTSNVISVKTKPEAPVATNATNITTSSFSANWQAVAGATGYKLWVISRENTGSNPAGYFPKSLGNVLSSTLTGLTPGHGYQYFVQTITADGESLSSNSVDVDTKPLAPVATSATNILNNSFTANWNTSAGATSYKIYVWKKEGMQFVTGYNGKSISGISETVTGLVAGTEYQYRVIALKNSTESDYSNTINAKTTGQQVTTYSVTLSAFPAAGGTVSGGGTFNSGSLVTALATPARGYEFVNWTESTKVASTAASYTFTLSANRTLVANFREKATDVLLTLTASPVLGGTVSGGGRFAPGTTVTISASANKGYEFVNWTEGTTVISTSSNLKFSLTANRTLTANFRAAIGSYSLNLSASPVAGGTTGGAGVYAPGTSVTATATPNAGYSFVNWKEGTTVVSTSASYTFTLNANRTLTANFQQNITGYTLSLLAGPEDGGTVTGGGAFAQGTSVIARATANPGYEFVNWTEGSTVVSTQANYTFTLNANRTLTAVFEQVTPSYSVWLSANPATGGSVSGEGTFSQGTSVTITATPAAGYDFTGWTDDGVPVSLSQNYTFTLNASRVLTANFTLKTAISDQKEKSGISIYPNPATDILNISGLKPGAVISLYGLNGAKIMTRKSTANPEKLDIRGMLKGLYLISVEENGMRFTHKITVR